MHFDRPSPSFAMLIMNIKNSLIGIITLAIVLAVILSFVYPEDGKEVLDSNVYYLLQDDTELINTNVDEDPNLANSIPTANTTNLNDETILVEEKSTAANNIINAGELNCSDVPFFSYKGFLENEKHSAKHGYFGEDDIAIYRSYAWSALEELGEQGDLLALKLLGETYLHQGNNEAAKTIFISAAVYGSTDALFNLARLSQMKVNKFIKSDNKGQIIKFTVENLAWYKVTKIRGIYLASDDFESMLELGIDDFTARNIDIDLAQLATLVQEHSIQLYKQLDTQRNKLGLEKFDNSTSKAEDGFYALYERFNKDDIGELLSRMDELAVECSLF